MPHMMTQLTPDGNLYGADSICEIHGCVMEWYPSEDLADHGYYYCEQCQDDLDAELDDYDE